MAAPLPIGLLDGHLRRGPHMRRPRGPSASPGPNSRGGPPRPPPAARVLAPGPRVGGLVLSKVEERHRGNCLPARHWGRGEEEESGQ